MLRFGGDSIACLGLDADNKRNHQRHQQHHHRHQQQDCTLKMAPASQLEILISIIRSNEKKGRSPRVALRLAFPCSKKDSTGYTTGTPQAHHTHVNWFKVSACRCWKTSWNNPRAIAHSPAFSHALMHAL